MMAAAEDEVDNNVFLYGAASESTLATLGSVLGCEARRGIRPPSPDLAKRRKVAPW